MSSDGTKTTARRKHTIVNDAVAAKMDKSNTSQSFIDFTVHITDGGDQVRTVERICQGIPHVE